MPQELTVIGTSYMVETSKVDEWICHKLDEAAAFEKKHGVDAPQVTASFSTVQLPVGFFPFVIVLSKEALVDYGAGEFDGHVVAIRPYILRALDPYRYNSCDIEKCAFGFMEDGRYPHGIYASWLLENILPKFDDTTETISILLDPIRVFRAMVQESQGTSAGYQIYITAVENYGRTDNNYTYIFDKVPEEFEDLMRRRLHPSEGAGK